ncbi:MAG: hypothetical protein ABJB16_18325 [Saprospiraceae bacterium]
MMLVSCKDLEFISDGVAIESKYDKNDLDTLSSFKTLPLKLKAVRCSIDSCSHTQHPVVILRSDDGVYVGRAALPCPPHCGGGKLISFAAYTR